VTTLPRDTVLVHGDSRQQEAGNESAGVMMKDHMKIYSGGGDAAAGVASERPGSERPGEKRPQ
jgi:hypothetical protein